MEKSYYVDSNTKIKNYGIYEYFNEVIKIYIKSFGIITKSKYIFKSDISNHYDTWKDVEKEYGNFPFWIHAWHVNKSELHIICIVDEEKYKINSFQLECILSMLNECRKYCVEQNESIKVEVPAICFKDNTERYTNDIDSLINEITEYLNELKMSNKSINNLKIFKLLKKEKSKRK